MLKEKIQVTHLSPLALHSILEYFMNQAETLLKIQYKIDNTKWSRVSKVYEGFEYSIIRHFGVMGQEINNLHTLFLLQSGKISNQKCRVNGKLVKSMEGKEITLISLEKAISLIEPYVTVFFDILSKAVPMNFDEQEEEKSRVLSGISDGDSSFDDKSYKEVDIQSFAEDQLLTNESKTVYLINYLHSFININCSSIMDRELIEVVIELFLDTLIPYLEIVNSWFTESANSGNDPDWKYDTNYIDLPRFLKPFMKEILQIRKSLMVIQIVRDDLMITHNEDIKSQFEQYKTWDFLKEVIKRIKDNIILHHSPLNLDNYTFEDIRPENLYADKRYNVNKCLQEAAQMQNKSLKL
jgi:hypothetical protein